MADTMTPADVMSMVNGADGFGGNNCWWIILLFLFIMNGNNGLFGNNSASEAAATSQEILYGQQFQGLADRITAVVDKVNQIGDGICDSTFALNNSIKDGGNAIQMQIANAVANNDKNTCEIVNAVRTDGEVTRTAVRALSDQITQNEIQTLRDKVNELNLAQAQCNQNAQIRAMLSNCGCVPCNC